MSELEKALKNMLLGSVGAVATAVEKTGELAKGFVEKGEEVVRTNKDKTDALQKRGNEVIDQLRKRFAELCKKPDIQDGTAEMTREERDALRARLDELDKMEEELERMSAELDSGCMEEAATKAGEAIGQAIDDVTASVKGTINDTSFQEAKENAKSLFDHLSQAVKDAVKAFGGTDAQKAETQKEEAAQASEPSAPEVKAADSEPEAVTPDPDEALLQTLQTRLGEFARRIEATRKALENRDDSDSSK